MLLSVIKENVLRARVNLFKNSPLQKLETYIVLDSQEKCVNVQWQYTRKRQLNVRKMLAENMGADSVV